MLHPEPFRAVLANLGDVFGADVYGEPVACGSRGPENALFRQSGGRVKARHIGHRHDAFPVIQRLGHELLAGFGHARERSRQLVELGGALARQGIVVGLQLGERLAGFGAELFDGLAVGGLRGGEPLLARSLRRLDFGFKALALGLQLLSGSALGDGVADAGAEAQGGNRQGRGGSRVFGRHARAFAEQGEKGRAAEAEESGYAERVLLEVLDGFHGCSLEGRWFR